MPPRLPPLRSLLPAEHGSWFMLGFPLALGWLLRPSLAGGGLALAALAAVQGRPPRSSGPFCCSGRRPRPSGSSRDASPMAAS